MKEYLGQECSTLRRLSRQKGKQTQHQQPETSKEIENLRKSPKKDIFRRELLPEMQRMEERTTAVKLSSSLELNIISGLLSWQK